MEYVPNILFALALIVGIGFFVRNVKKLTRNIKLGKDVDVSDNKAQRWKNMARIALGQTKMVVRPIAGSSMSVLSSSILRCSKLSLMDFLEHIDCSLPWVLCITS